MPKSLFCASLNEDQLKLSPPETQERLMRIHVKKPVQLTDGQKMSYRRLLNFHFLLALLTASQSLTLQALRQEEKILKQQELYQAYTDRVITEAAISQFFMKLISHVTAVSSVNAIASLWYVYLFHRLLACMNRSASALGKRFCCRNLKVRPRTRLFCKIHPPSCYGS